MKFISEILPIFIFIINFFFDIHPLAQFIITLFAYLLEYDGDIQFSNIYGHDYSSVDYISLRITQIIFSSLISPLIYLFFLFSSFSIIASIISSSFILFDTSFLCEGKFILTDGILNFFVSLCICCINYWLSIDQKCIHSDIIMYITSLFFRLLFFCQIFFVFTLFCYWVYADN